MIVLFMKDSGDEVEIRATKEDFETFASQLIMAPFSLNCETEGVDPAPYDQFIKRIGVECVGEDLTISIHDDCTLQFSGNNRSLKMLSDNISNFCEFGHPGTHFHLEYVPEEHFGDPNSIPLVFSLL